MSNISKPKIASKRHAPPAVQWLIKLANSVPVDLELPPPHGRVEEIVKLLRTEACSRFRDLTGPVEADSFLTKLIGPEAPKTYKKVMGSYMLLRDGRNWLRQAAVIGKLTLAISYVMPLVSAQVNEQGQLEFNIDPLIKALDHVEVSKIRTCAVCGAIFWAPRSDSPCCSIRCAKVERSRRFRRKYLDRYKLQRVARGANRI